ncbi:MAG: YncE family protein [Pseudomonadota bacterium]
MNNAGKAGPDFAVVYYIGDRKTGSIHIVQRSNGRTSVEHLPVEPDTGLDKMLKPILAGVTPERQVVQLDPRTKEIRVRATFPADGFLAHLYADPYSSRDWFMNDGDKETGNDTLNCGDKGSSVTVIDNTASAGARFLKTICVGRGHHQAAFTVPSATAPNVPRRAWISSLNDGAITVIGNDPQDAATYLAVLATINLCEAAREDGVAGKIPNTAYPHGLAYSPSSGKLYNLNSGYGTLAIIDPLTNAIEERMNLKGYSNLFATPGGRYLIARGADRKSDPHHVIAKVAVFDTVTNEVVDTLDVPDVYLSKYYFNPEGGKLYFTTSSSGSPEQQANLKTDVVLSFDLTALPKLRLTQQIKCGPSGSLAFLAPNRRTERVFASHAEDGTLVVIDGQSDAVLESIEVTAPGTHSRIWMLGDRA